MKKIFNSDCRGRKYVYSGNSALIVRKKRAVSHQKNKVL